METLTEAEGKKHWEVGEVRDGISNVYNTSALAGLLGSDPTPISGCAGSELP